METIVLTSESLLLLLWFVVMSALKKIFICMSQKFDVWKLKFSQNLQPLSEFIVFNF